MVTSAEVKGQKFSILSQRVYYIPFKEIETERMCLTDSAVLF